jgi:hypothetical protein
MDTTSLQKLDLVICQQKEIISQFLSVGVVTIQVSPQGLAFVLHQNFNQ